MIESIASIGVMSALILVSWLWRRRLPQMPSYGQLRLEIGERLWEPGDHNKPPKIYASKIGDSHDWDFLDA